MIIVQIELYASWWGIVWRNYFEKKMDTNQVLQFAIFTKYVTTVNIVFRAYASTSVVLVTLTL